MTITYGQMAKALGLPEDADHAIIDAKFREIGEERKTARLRETAAELHDGNPYSPLRVSGVRLHAEAEVILGKDDYTDREYAEALEQAEAHLGPEAKYDTLELDEVAGLDADKVEALRRDYISRRGTELVQARWGVDEETATYQQLSGAYVQASQEFEATLAQATGKETR
ncbi:MAG: hypothetical protein ACRDOS_17000 [Gaiellaceae bacterium]